MVFTPRNSLSEEREVVTQEKEVGPKSSQISVECHLLLFTPSTVHNSAYMCSFWLQCSLSVAHTHPRDRLQPLEAAPGDYRGVRSASPTFELRPRIGRVSRVHLRKLGKAHSGPKSLIYYPKRVPPAPRAGVTNEPAPGGEKGRRALLLSMESSYGQIN